MILTTSKYIALCSFIALVVSCKTNRRKPLMSGTQAKLTLSFVQGENTDFENEASEKKVTWKYNLSECITKQINGTYNRQNNTIDFSSNLIRKARGKDCTLKITTNDVSFSELNTLLGEDGVTYQQTAIRIIKDKPGIYSAKLKTLKMYNTKKPQNPQNVTIEIKPIFPPNTTTKQKENLQGKLKCNPKIAETAPGLINSFKFTNKPIAQNIICTKFNLFQNGRHVYESTINKTLLSVNGPVFSINDIKLSKVKLIIPNNPQSGQNNTQGQGNTQNGQSNPQSGQGSSDKDLEINIESKTCKNFDIIKRICND